MSKRIMKGRTLVIGDIHGGLLALKQVLERAEVTQKDKLIFLGDYVDGWSESAGVIELIMQLEKKNECVFIIGNHDQWCLEWLLTNEMNETGYLHGGKATMQSYEGMSVSLKNKHLRFFRSMKRYVIDKQNRLFVHAGFASMHGPHRDDALTPLWDRTLWEMAVAMDRNLDHGSLFFPKRLKLYTEIYIGHTPTTNYGITVPMQVHTLWNTDTGAAFGDRLTILDVDSKKYWQSDPLNVLYPDEPGRKR